MEFRYNVMELDDMGIHSGALFPTGNKAVLVDFLASVGPTGFDRSYCKCKGRCPSRVVLGHPRAGDVLYEPMEGQSSVQFASPYH